MIARSRLVCLVAIVGCLVAAQQAVSQEANTDELKFKGDEATNLDTNDHQQTSPAPSGAYTNDQGHTSPTPPGTYTNDQEHSSPVPSNTNIMPMENPGQDDQGNRRPFRRFGGPFGFPFGGPPPFGGSPFGGSPGNIFERFFNHFDRHAQELERQFGDLERQASQGQEVSYFQRNGEAYVRTCTTRKVNPGEQISDDQEIKNLRAPVSS